MTLSRKFCLRELCLSTSLAAVTATCASAATVNLSWTGTVSDIQGPGIDEADGVLDQIQLGIGQTADFQLTYDTESAPASTSFEPGFVEYSFPSDVASLSISAGDLAWGGTVGLTIGIIDDVEFGHSGGTTYDEFVVYVRDPLPVLSSPPGTQVPNLDNADFTISTINQAGSEGFLSSLSLPTSESEWNFGIDESALDLAEVFIRHSSPGFDDDGFTAVFDVNPDTLKFGTSIPEPIVPKSEGYLGKERKLLGDVDASGETEFDVSKPIVIVTHGWQGGPLNRAEYNGEISGSAFSEILYDRIKAEYKDDVNVVVYAWEEAYVGFGKALGDDWSAEPELPAILDEVGLDLGIKLRKLFQNTIGDGEYAENIHFVGHSYGTKVNLHAVDFLNRLGYEVEQFTILDAPTDNGIITGQLDVSDYTRFALSELNKNTYIENFYGTAPGLAGAYGSPIPGAEFNEGYELSLADHTEVWQIYAETIPGGADILPDMEYRGDGFLNSAALEALGGTWADRPTSVKQTLLSELSTEFAPMSILNSKNSSIAVGTPIGTVLDVSTASDGFMVFDVFVPNLTSFMAFDLSFPKKGDGDWLEILVGEDLIFQLTGDLISGEPLPFYLDFAKYAGRSDRVSFLLSSTGSESASARLSNVRWVSYLDTPSSVPIPLPLLGLLTCLGSLLVFVRNTRELT